MKKNIFVVMLLFLLFLTPLLIDRYFTTEGKIKLALSKSIEPIIKELQNSSELSDISYHIQIDNILSDTLAEGDIIFHSKMLETYTPEEKYNIMQTISQVFWEKLGIPLNSGEYTLTISHGSVYSEWETKNDTYYVASYYSLEQNGEKIYDNPNNDLEKDMEEFFGMPYDEWKKLHDEPQIIENYVPIDSESDEFFFALTAAQNLVKNELKSPQTAKFSFDTDDYSISRSGNKWIVSGYVDAQNSFGATLRQYWTASFTMGDTSGSKYNVSNYSVIFNN